MDLRQNVKTRFQGLLEIPEEGTSPERYRAIRRNFVILMLLVTVIPLAIMAFINYHQYRSALKDEIVNPLRVLVSKTKHSFELFLANRLATVRFVAHAYSYEELADEKNLQRIFRALRQEFQGFVDIGLIDANGVQVSYSGPYDELQGKDYSQQEWFQHVRVEDFYISDVFMGYRRFPHMVIAAKRVGNGGRTFIVRATIDTGRFDELIASMSLGAYGDAFVINRAGVFQTNSKFYGKVLDQCPFCPVTPSFEPNVLELKDPAGRDVMLAYASFWRSDFVLMLVKPRAEILRGWYSLQSELAFVFVASVAVIFFVVFRLTKILVTRMQQSDQRRELALRQMQHSHKLSSVGRLAAGVAHEINNPMAIINEKAGLMKDLIELTPDFPDKAKFLGPLAAIVSAVERCRTITHRLLGFAKRMDVEMEILDVNEVLQETAGFLEKEALHRNIKFRLHLEPNLPRIESDRGQLQQVFLNILNNAFAAVENGGMVSVASWEKDIDTVALSFHDNGCGMSEETLRHIFEPFFTTKKEAGTGLGLSITYGIIRKIGGDINVQSKEGEGTRFTVYLPKKPKRGSGE
ncbi:MAG: two-component sensor histidine kinase [Desulfomonile tiedjei]|nr:two-component sensor histidine kinase [Desulfomonile tiedjei]